MVLTKVYRSAVKDNFIAKIHDRQRSGYYYSKTETVEVVNLEDLMPKVTVLETELVEVSELESAPMIAGNRKGALKASGGKLGCLYDSRRFDDPWYRSRSASHSAKKDSKSYRPWRKTGSVVKNYAL